MSGAKVISIARILNLFEKLIPHPNYNEIEVSTWETLLNLGMANKDQEQHYLKQQVSLFIALAYPQANLDYLKFVNDVMNWVLYFDDRVDHKDGDFRRDAGLRESTLSRFLNVVKDLNSEQKDVVEDKQLAFLEYIVRQAKQMLTDEDILENFLKQLETFFLDAMKINSYSKCSPVEKFSIYTKVRYATGALPVWYALIRQMVTWQHLERSNYNPVIFQDMDIKRLEDIGALAFLLFNDIVSYEREAGTATATENMVVLLQQLRQCDISTAMEETIDMIEQHIQEFDEIVQKRMTAGTLCDVLQEYARGIKTFMLANCQWYISSGRYLTPTNPVLECRLTPKDA